MTTSPVKTLEEAAKDVELHKVHPENFFSELGKSSTFDGLCNGIELKVGFKRTEVKELCSKLVRVLEKLSKAGDSERNKYCSYVRYWLYEQISKIHTNKSAKIADVPFFDKLILAWTVISMAKLSKCKPENNIKDIKLDELKKRIFSYIYFKNIDKIKKISTENGTDCDKYLTYLKSFKSVHEEYKDKLCGESTVLSQKNGTDYFHCNDKDTNRFSSRSKLIEFINYCNNNNCSNCNKTSNNCNNSNCNATNSNNNCINCINCINYTK
ncbi:VIR protein [Plasmodium vivax]|uniref:VIR protein n=1 Tax=Plasmodium vivax TaxID=5855 RepID=A0A1G4EC88_PLAVI|nr:VIR protein [Plasmodium vivax]